MFSKECRATGKACLSRDGRKDAGYHQKECQEIKVKQDDEEKEDVRKPPKLKVLPGRVTGVD